MIRKRVLVTGGGGFVGSHMAAGYHALGHAVTALDRAFDAATRTRLTDVEMVEAELTRQSLAALTGRFDLVLHAAAVTARAGHGESDLTDLRSNIELLVDCLDYAIASGASTFVFLSSLGVFAEGDGVDAVDEQTPATAITQYAVAKRCGELIMTSAGGRGCRLVTVRLGPIYGPCEVARETRVRTSLVQRLLDAGGEGSFHLDTPNARRDWTFVADLPLALEAVLRQHDGDLLVHLGSGAILTDRQLANHIVRHLDRAITITEAEMPHAAIKAPMVSKLATDFQWTPLEIGLARTLATEARS